jgi:hypothetical protein
MDYRDIFYSAIIALIVLLVLAVGYYQFFGWKKFAFSTGNVTSWTGNNTSKLRFRRAVFTITPPGQQSYKKDVSAVLNSMAVAYAGVPNSGTLKLDRPLNAFSFLIPGVNDSKTVPNPASWKNAPATLVGEYREL